MSIRKKLFATGLCSIPQGSWRWQNAFQINIYGIRRNKNGKLIWFRCGSFSGKMSMPQIRKRGYGYDYGHSPHQTPLNKKGVEILTKKAAKIIGEQKMERGLRLAKRLIPGLENAVSL